MELTRENVNQLFSECEWKIEDWPKEATSIENAPDVAWMLIPLSNGINIAGFYPDKILVYSDTISELLDQVPYLSEKTGKHYSQSNISQKLMRKTLKYEEAKIIGEILGYELKFIRVKPYI